MKQAAQRTLQQAVRTAAPRPAVVRAARPIASTSAGRPFSSTAFRREEKKDEAGEKKKKDEYRDTTVEGRSPVQAFIDVFRDELRKNREWQDSVKQLGGEVSKVQDSEAMQRAKAMYERARVSSPSSRSTGLSANAGRGLTSLCRLSCR